MENIHKQFLILEKSHLARQTRQANWRMAEVLDDDFFEFGSSGGVSQRSDFDGDGALEGDEYYISRFEVKVLCPESVLTIYLVENQTTKVWSHRSSVWKKRVDGWKLFFHQGTETNGFKKWE